MTNISRCYCCHERIDHVAGKWRHRGGVQYSPVGGDHMASPFNPETSVVDPRQPAVDDVPPDSHSQTGGTSQ